MNLQVKKWARLGVFSVHRLSHKILIFLMVMLELLRLGQEYQETVWTGLQEFKSATQIAFTGLCTSKGDSTRIFQSANFTQNINIFYVKVKISPEVLRISRHGFDRVVKLLKCHSKCVKATLQVNRGHDQQFFSIVLYIQYFIWYLLKLLY